MITVAEVKLSYGARELFNGITATIGPRDRIGLVGSNGAGKSTFLEVLMGLEEIDGGRVDKPPYVTLGYLPQEMPGTSGRTLLAEARLAFSDVLALQKSIEEASARLRELEPATPEYGETLELIGGWEHQLEAHEPEKMETRIKHVLHGLGFAEADMERDCGEFSGGWQMRILLAKLLLQEPSLLLMDEPTNHLDLESVRWLEKFLRSYEGSVMIVSHDRAFLDALTNRTFALSRGRLDVYAGNYSYFERVSAERREQLIRAAKNQAKQIADTERFIDRFRAKNTKAAQVQSRIKQLAKIDRIEVEEEEREVFFKFPPPPPSGQMVVELSGVTKNYGPLNVFRGLDLKIQKGDRFAVVGVNGAGKSTLAKILAGVEPIQAGERKVNPMTVMRYFAQHQALLLDPEKTVLEEAESAAPPGQARRARDILGAFLFRGDDAKKPVRVLSGGERNRLALAKMLLQPFNFLILDEPTNHLDMRSKRVLQQAIVDYPGTLLLVSHDREFLDPIVDRVLEVSKSSTRLFHGNISSYITRIDEERAATAAPGEPPAAARRPGASAAGLPASPTPTGPTPAEATLSPKERRQRTAALQQQLKPVKNRILALEKAIAEKEAELARLESAMMDPAFFKRGAETKRDVDRAEQLKREIEDAYAAWGTATEELTAAEAALG